MFTVNSILIYRSRICKVSDVREETFGKESKTYCVLTPLYDDKNTIYVPLDNPELMGKIKEVITQEEVYSLIEYAKTESMDWITDNKERPAKFKDILENGTREEIILVLKSLKEHRDELAAIGKFLHSSDEALLNRAEKTIYNEFAFVLGINPNQIEEFLKSKNASF